MERTRQLCFLFVATALAVGTANALEGGREIPARLLPVPDTVSPAMQAAIGAPPLPFWNTHPKSADEWKAFVQQLADVTLKTLPLLREQTGVNITVVIFV
jgi:epsilon-lactone hydrolase